MDSGSCCGCARRPGWGLGQDTSYVVTLSPFFLLLGELTLRLWASVLMAVGPPAAAAGSPQGQVSLPRTRNTGSIITLIIASSQTH